jgi:hypothetical protein
MYVYFCRYHRSILSRRIYRETVRARNPDEARAKLAIKDPLCTGTIEVKNGGGVKRAVVEAAR